MFFGDVLYIQYLISIYRIEIIVSVWAHAGVIQNQRKAKLDARQLVHFHHADLFNSMCTIHFTPVCIYVILYYVLKRKV